MVWEEVGSLKPVVEMDGELIFQKIIKADGVYGASRFLVCHSCKPSRFCVLCPVLPTVVGCELENRRE